MAERAYMSSIERWLAVRRSSSACCVKQLTFAGTPRNLEDICKACLGHGQLAPGAVIVTLIPSRTSDSPFARPVAPPRFMADSVANAITVMKQHNIPKIVVMQALGVGDSFPNLPVWMRSVRHWTYMKHSYDDHDLVDKEVKSSGVKLCAASPTLAYKWKIDTVRGGQQVSKQATCKRLGLSGVDDRLGLQAGIKAWLGKPASQAA